MARAHSIAHSLKECPVIVRYGIICILCLHVQGGFCYWYSGSYFLWLWVICWCLGTWVLGYKRVIWVLRDWLQCCSSFMLSTDSCPCVLIYFPTCSPAIAKPLLLFCQVLDVLFVFLTQVHCHIFSFCLLPGYLLPRVEHCYSVWDVCLFLQLQIPQKWELKEVGFVVYLPHQVNCDINCTMKKYCAMLKKKSCPLNTKGECYLQLVILI